MFDLKAKDHYNSVNPLIRILLPKMNYSDSERGMVFRKALTGLYQLTSAVMFEKYTEFIDAYSGIPDEEREAIYRELSEEEETAMITLTQDFKEKGIEQGIRQGMQQGLIEGIEVAIHLRFGAKGARLLKNIRSIEDINVLRTIKEALITAETADDIETMINQHI